MNTLSRLTTTGPFGQVADVQKQVIRRDQLRAVEVTKASLQAQLDARRWQTVGPHVIVLHNGPLTPGQQLWAAVLNADGPAALCGRTAAAEAGLFGWPAVAIDVVVVRGAKVPKIPGINIKVHESRRFTEADIHPTATPPRTPIARSAIDSAAWTRPPRGACGIVASTVQQRLCRAEHLLAELDMAGCIRHRRLLQSTLVDIEGGSQALSELDFLRFCRKHNLPEPERQVIRYDSEGRRRYLDAVLRAPNGRVALVEIDGAAHLQVVTYWDDMYRDNEATIDGEVQLRYPSIAMRIDGERMARQLRRALGLDTCQNVNGL
jgi:hypothetical protein